MLKTDEEGNCLIKCIGERAFSSKTMPSKIIIPSSVTKIEEWAFYGVITSHVDVHENVHLANYSFYGSKMSTIDIRTPYFEGASIFNSCTNLKTIALPNLTVLLDSTFNGCTQLESIELPDSLQLISSSVFMNTNLKSLTIPANVTEIGKNSFWGCKQLGDITCLPTKAPSLGEEVFGKSTTNYTGINATTKTLTVPSNAIGYESGDWKTVLQDKVGFTLNKTT